MREYLKKFLDQTDPTASLKHAAYASVICFGCGWLTYDLMVKTIEAGVKRGITAQWNVAFGLLLAAVTTGKVMGKQDGQ
jgi:hypothetical protein